MKKKKLNCWEYKKCGREADGSNSDKLGICPAVTENKYHGVHGGTNAGRICWIVAGTCCKDKKQGTFAQKIDTCQQCDFFQHVFNEER